MSIVYTVDLTAQATQAIAGTGAVTIDGLTWYSKGSLSSGTLERGLLNGGGLYIGTVSGFTTPVIGTAGELTFPHFFLPFTSVPDFDPNKAYLIRGRFSTNKAQNVHPLLGVVDTTSDDVNLATTQRARDRLIGAPAAASASLALAYKLGITGLVTTGSQRVATLQNECVVGLYHLTPRFAAVGSELLASGMPSGLTTWLPHDTASIKDYATVTNPGVLFTTHYIFPAAGDVPVRTYLTHLQIETIGDAADLNVPTVTLVSPPELTRLRRHDAIVFDVSDANLGYHAIQFIYDDLGIVEGAWDSADPTLTTLYKVTREAIASGWRYTVRRRSGWPSRPRIRVRATDGNAS